MFRYYTNIYTNFIIQSEQSKSQSFCTNQCFIYHWSVYNNIYASVEKLYKEDRFVYGKRKAI